MESALEAECRQLNDHETEQRHVANSLEEMRASRRLDSDTSNWQIIRRPLVRHLDIDGVMLVRS